jgi:hypothetical protein
MVKTFTIHLYGGVAQMVRADGSYPSCPGFESLHRHSCKAVALMKCGLFYF